MRAGEELPPAAVAATSRLLEIERIDWRSSAEASEPVKRCHPLCRPSCNISTRKEEMRMPEVKKIVLSNGKVRYRVEGLDLGRDPATGRRLQKTITKDRRKDVVDEIARITHQRRTCDYVQPSNLTVAEALDRLIPALTVDVGQATAANYADAMRPVRARLARPLSAGSLSTRRNDAARRRYFRRARRGHPCRRPFRFRGLRPEAREGARQDGPRRRRP